MAAKDSPRAQSLEDRFGSLSRPTFDDLVSGLEEWCRATLIKAGFDPDNGIVYPAKRWKGRTKYAHTIWKYLVCARDGIDLNDAVYAAIYALKLGLSVREHQLIGLARRGQDACRKDGSKPSQSSNPRGRLPKTKDKEDKSARDDRMCAEYAARRKTSKLSDTALMKLIGQEQTPPLQRTRAIEIISKHNQ